VTSLMGFLLRGAPRGVDRQRRFVAVATIEAPAVQTSPNNMRAYLGDLCNGVSGIYFRRVRAHCSDIQ